MKIEKGVPIPEQSSGPTKYNFEAMQVGDSFIADKHEKKGHSPKAYNAAIAWGKNNGASFTGRKMPDGSFRVWRIK